MIKNKSNFIWNIFLLYYENASYNINRAPFMYWIPLSYFYILINIFIFLYSKQIKLILLKYKYKYFNIKIFIK